MAATTPLRENILNNIKTTLAAIAPSAYRTHVKIVSRVFKHYDELAPSDFPALYILDNGGVLSPETSAKVYEEDMSVIIVGYVRWNENASDDDIASTQLNNLIADVTEALNEDRQRGTNSDGDDNAISTNVTDIEAVQGETEPFAFVSISVTVKLNYKSTDVGKAFHC